MQLLLQVGFPMISLLLLSTNDVVESALVVETFTGCTNNLPGTADIDLEPARDGRCQISLEGGQQRFKIDCANQVKAFFSDAACTSQSSTTPLDGVCRNGVRKVCSIMNEPFRVVRQNSGDTSCNAQEQNGELFRRMETCFSTGRVEFSRYDLVNATRLEEVEYATLTDCQNRVQTAVNHSQM